MTKTKAAKIPEPYECSNRYGILNPYGDVWSPETFDSMDAALKHLTKFWGPRDDLSRFTVIPVRVIVSAIR